MNRLGKTKSKLHAGGTFLLALILLTWSSCTMKKEKKMVGELERLGPEGRDVLVLGVDAPGFKKLPTDRKIFAYYLYRAAIAGDNIFFMQNHRDALEIKQLLEAIYLHSQGMEDGLREAVHDYLKYIWIHHGQYNHYSHHKFVPNKLTPKGLRKAVKYALEHGANIMTMPGETVDSKIDRLEPSIFRASFEPLQKGDTGTSDIIAASASNFYGPGVTQEDIDKLIRYWRDKLNVRFVKINGEITPQIYKIGGLYSRELETVNYFLKLALPYAENAEQKAAIQALIDFYITGDEALFRESSIHWLKAKTTIDFLNGFIEQYTDPRGIIGSYEANASYAADSGPVEKLAANALYFEKKMPWPDEYKRQHIEKPVASLVNVLVETGDAGPVSPAAYNLPNYNDIRRDYGSKNVILINVENSRSRQIFEAQVKEFYLPEYRKALLKYGLNTVRPWLVYMHEIIGHGSGQPDPDLRGDPRTLLRSVYPALEECRADLVALYHISDPKLPDIGAFEQEDQKDITMTMYINYLQGWFSRFDRIEGNEVREAHNKGSHLILMYLVENGGDRGKDFGVEVIKQNGNYYVKINDMGKVRLGLGELLDKLEVIKSTADVQAAEALFNKFGTKVPSEWKANVVRRKEKLRIPKLKAFVFPRLIPVMKDGKLVDVDIAFDEDLTAQHLRFSRLQYIMDIRAQ